MVMAISMIGAKVVGPDKVKGIQNHHKQRPIFFFFRKNYDYNRSNPNLQDVDEGPIPYIDSKLLQTHYKISHLNRN